MRSKDILKEHSLSVAYSDRNILLVYVNVYEQTTMPSLKTGQKFTFTLGLLIPH